MLEKISRRTLLGMGAAGAAVLMLGGTVLFVRLSDMRDLIRRMLAKSCPDIVFDGEDLDQFTAYCMGMYEERMTPSLRKAVLNLHPMATSGPFHMLMPGKLAVRVDEIEQIFLREFFLVTDFFQGPYEKGRRVYVTRAFDPYEAVCSNPLAEFESRPED